MQHKVLNLILKKLEIIESRLPKSDEKSLNDFISEHEAMKILKRGRSWFWELRSAGFPFTKLGAQVYYNKKDLIKYFEDNKIGGE